MQTESWMTRLTPASHALFLLGQCQSAGIQHLGPRQFITEPAALLVSNDQDRFERDNHRRG